MQSWIGLGESQTDFTGPLAVIAPLSIKQRTDHLDVNA